MLNVHQLNVFVTAAETLNFTQTAKRMHLTQSSVSQIIKTLENQLEVKLFKRKARTLTITDAGNVLLPLAREIVEGSIRASERMELMKQKVHGHLIVGCNTAPGKYVLPILLAKFNEVYPLVRFTCKVLPQDQALNKLSEGDIHFAFTNVGEMNHGTTEIQLYLQEPLVLIVPNGHNWTKQKEIEPEELLDERFIMREPGSGTYTNVKRGLAELGIDIAKLNVFMEMGTSEAIALAVQQGLGVGFISNMIVQKICQDSVYSVKVKGLDIIQNIYFGRQTVQPASSAEVAFWNFIRDLDTSIFKTNSQVK
ncbi:MAG: LysR family transcriptional regulator [Planctomycetes bacterium]|nr:LysR family transcriptional regulator [Planctomycetota bacterium]